MSSDQTYTLVFLVTAFPPEISGASYTNWERVQWLAKQGMYRVVVFAPDWQNEEPSSPALSDLDEKLIIERYPSKPWPPYNLTYVPRFPVARQINEKLAYYQPDLITMTDVERFFLLSTWQLPGRHYAKQHRIPYLAEYHTDIYNFSATYPGWQWLRGLIRTSNLTKHLYHPFDTTLCFSQAASKSCQDMGISNVHTMPYYVVDLSMCSPNRRNRQWLTPWLSEHEQNHKVLLFLGRLGFEKRVDLLIEAFAKLKSQQPNCSLIIAGDGPLNVVNQLQRLAAPVPDIHFTGFLLGETKANLLASCDVFCSPSPYETFGRTIVEAMASGIPVVTVNSGAVTEYLLDGINGYLVPPDDVEGLAHGISQALSTNNLEIIHRASQDVQQFSFEQSCQNLHHYYQQLLGLNHDSKVNVTKKIGTPY